MIHIQQRQNSSGRWWCNTTYRGYDYSEEGETLYEAELLIRATLQRINAIGELHFEESKYYTTADDADYNKENIWSLRPKLDHL